jgi:hypothetical protein
MPALLAFDRKGNQMKRFSVESNLGRPHENVFDAMTCDVFKAFFHVLTKVA